MYKNRAEGGGLPPNEVHCIIKNKWSRIKFSCFTIQYKLIEIEKISDRQCNNKSFSLLFSLYKPFNLSSISAYKNLDLNLTNLTFHFALIINTKWLFCYTWIWHKVSSFWEYQSIIDSIQDSNTTWHDIQTHLYRLNYTHWNRCKCSTLYVYNSVGNTFRQGI